MAINWEILKMRYLQTSRASLMDSLSLNLARLQSLSSSGGDSVIAHHLVRESQYFIEWTVSGINLETDMALATELLTLQRQLSQWKLRWSELWESEPSRQQVSATAQTWSEQLQERLNVMVPPANANAS